MGWRFAAIHWSGTPPIRPGWKKPCVFQLLNDVGDFQNVISDTFYDCQITVRLKTF